jgi:transcriptional regulator with GAF, ATPase, and Fis domain
MSKPRPLQVLLAVSDPAAGPALQEYFRKRGMHCGLAGPADPPPQGPADLVVFEMAGETMHWLQSHPAGSTLIALARPDPETYFVAAKAGVEAVLPLPLGDDYARKLDAICEQIQGRLAQPTHIPGLFATSEDMAEVRDLIEKVAPTSATVLIKGESGVGKELAAQLIHSLSNRNGHPFVKVNCAAIPNELLESELFGYEAGAFTGAVKARPGKFEQANGGTIFLDEIGELHPVLQAKLLHVLQDGEFARLGSRRDTAVDVRVICATNKLLDVLVANGLFREDLFYRINVVTVSLPPLRSRPREIPVLIDYFLQRYAALYNKPLVPFEPETMQTLMTYHWPGNIRELENLCKRYVIVGGVAQILRELEQRGERRQPLILEKATLRRDSIGPAGGPSDAPSLLEIGRRAAWAAERAAIESMLEETHWNRREAARRLGVSYKALLNKIAQIKEEEENLQVVS